MRSRQAFARLSLAAVIASPSAAFGATLTASPALAAAVPGAPHSVAAVPYQSFAAQLVWKAPTTDGGSPIIGWSVTPYIGSVVKKTRFFSSTKPTAIVNDLHNGQTYRFKVAAQNAVGWGPASALSSAVIVGAPGRPKITGIAKDETPGKVLVRFHLPFHSAARVTHVTTTCISSNGGATSTFQTEDARNALVGGSLTVGKTYRCRLSATNKFGTGPRSTPSAAIVM